MKILFLNKYKSSFTTTIFSFVLAGLFVTACNPPAPAKTIEPITSGSVAATETAASKCCGCSIPESAGTILAVESKKQRHFVNYAVDIADK